MNFQDFISNPATVAAMAAGGTSLITYLVNKGKIKADTENIVASTYQKLVQDLDHQLEHIRERVNSLEERLKLSQLDLEHAIEEKKILLEEIKKIRKRNEELLRDNHSLLKRSDEMIVANGELLRENNRLQSKIILLEQQIAQLMVNVKNL